MDPLPIFDKTIIISEPDFRLSAYVHLHDVSLSQCEHEVSGSDGCNKAATVGRMNLCPFIEL